MATLGAALVAIVVVVSGCHLRPVQPSTTTPTPTPPPTPTVTPTPNVTSPLGLPTAWSLTLQDTLLADDAYHWDTGPQNPATNRQFTQGGYLLSAPIGDGVDGVANDGPQLTNFYAEVTATIQSGAQHDGGDAGLEVRVDSAGDTYIFSVDADGFWYFSLSLANAPNATELARGINTAVLAGQGKPNLLGIKAQGQTFTLYANNHQVGAVTNSVVTTGLIGLEVTGGDNLPASALFTNLRIWTP